MRLLAKAAIVALSALLLSMVALAEPVSRLHPTGYVDDFAHVLDSKTVAQIEDICQQIDQKGHAQIAVVTINSLDGADVESYAVDLFKSWGIGQKSTNRGVLILYAIQDHRARIEVGYGLEPILPDGKVGGFQREAIPLMRSGNTSAALLLVTDRVAGVIAQDAGIQISNALPPAVVPPPAEPDEQHISLGGIIVIVVIVLIILCTPLRGVLFWLLLSQMFGGRGGGWGGGGFGGRWRRVRRLWGRQFRWRRGKQQLVTGEDVMVPENKIEEFVRRMSAAAGANLESVILYGSAVAGDFHPEFSNLNLFCVLGDSSFPALQALAPVAQWWEKQKQPPPLLMTRRELQCSHDIFTIELLDMQQHHRVLFGEDVLLGLQIPVHSHGLQVEYELREKLLLLRQQRCWPRATGGGWGT